MKLKIENCRCLAVESNVSKQGKEYRVALFQKGVDTVKFFLSDEIHVVEENYYDLECNYFDKSNSISLVDAFLV